ncbi:hypothetical protein CWATWH0402_5775 [Crocosphaera watsonii WH 0402]|nr:hypothetical protein CWATWH0402_5775 [Crocosphaera watsonii WH 0402]
MTLFIGRLQHLGIDVKPIITATGRKRISYHIDGAKPFRGSKLHNGSFPKLISQRGVNCDPQRDRKAMEYAVNHQQVTLPPEQLINWSEINLSLYLPKALDTESLGKEKQKKTEKALINHSRINTINQSSEKLEKEKALMSSLPLTPEFSPDVIEKQQEYTLTIAPIAYRWLKANQTVRYEAKDNLIEYSQGRLTIKDGEGNYKMIAQSVGVEQHNFQQWQCINLPQNSPGLTQKDVERFTGSEMKDALRELEQKNNQFIKRRKGRGR